MDEQEDRDLGGMRNAKDDKVWRKANIMLGKEKSRREVRIVEDGGALEKDEGFKKVCEFWEGIYWDERKIEKNFGDQTREGSELRGLIKKVDEEMRVGKDREAKIDHGYAAEPRPWNFLSKIGPEEVNKAMKEMKKGKAAGMSGINGEMWKAVYEKLGDGRFADWFNDVVEGEKPESWGRSKVLLIPKKKGSRMEKGDFRPVTVTEASYKIFGTILRERLERFAVENGLLREEQSGFTKGRQLEENIVALGLEIERARRRKGALYVAAVDLRKAFDLVDREFLVEYLRKVGLEKEWIDSIRDVYETEELCLFVGEEFIG